MTKYCNKYCNAGEKVLLRWRKKTADHRNIKHLEPRVASLNLVNKQKKEAGHSGCSTGRNA